MLNLSTKQNYLHVQMKAKHKMLKNKVSGYNWEGLKKDLNHHRILEEHLKIEFHKL
jgi:hypothetical protein